MALIRAVVTLLLLAAVAVALEMRESGLAQNDLVARLGGDDRLGLGADAVASAMGDPMTFIGNAEGQTAAFVTAVEALAAKYPDAAAYQSGDIL